MAGFTWSGLERQRRNSLREREGRGRTLWQGDGVHLCDELNSRPLGHDLGVNPGGLSIGGAGGRCLDKGVKP